MEKISYAVSLVFFWVKGFVAVDYRFINTSKPNTVLGFIPAGKDNQSIPLKNVSSASISSSYKLKPMFIGFVLFMVSFSYTESSIIAFIFFLVLGAGIFGSGIQTNLCIQRAGSDYIISVPFFEKAKLYVIKDRINNALAVDADKTDLSLYHKKIEEA